MQTLSLGKHNPKLIDVRKAIHNATLTREGLLPVEGPKLLAEALRSGLEIASIFKRRDSILSVVPASIPVYEIEPAIFGTIQSTEASQGVISLVRPRQYSLTKLLTSASPLLIVLARLQDPGNVGTILRVAEAFGADGCLATTGTASIFNPKTVRASAGTLFRFPHVWDLDMKQIASMLKASNVSIVGTAPSGRETIIEHDWRRPSAILIGNEGNGLSEEEMQLCDTLVRIPHVPTVESLNSAIAAAVTLYESFRQRNAL